ncbi:gas vesicle protein [Mycobacterium frederiksbergense]|uniref:Gas vesicle protein n=1 Tax=Mycolicibacterium frederiksbergense TaxID=117567 RepID=A0ABT6KVL7_9MYCO|nr:zinc ribbon domain-containing protein [Mycolicibacterium frederiksbergense]MDH6194027.1 gas vesicle protein [Mycolicibacterium frederiksbergense]
MNDMSACPNGHRNPAHWEFCNECGEPIDDSEQSRPATARQRIRRKGLLVGGGVVLAVVGAAAVVLIAQNSDRASSQPHSVTAMADWWADSHQDVAEFRAALLDTEQAIQTQDTGVLHQVCQQLHDTAGVHIPARLPTPDAQLTSELQAAARDAHDASHMCLAAVAGSMNSYRGEFAADIDQADKHLAAAQKIIDHAVPEDRYAVKRGFMTAQPTPRLLQG